MQFDHVPNILIIFAKLIFFEFKMINLSKIVESAVANHCEVMVADSILKNGQSSKSHTSRGNNKINVMMKKNILGVTVGRRHLYIRW